MVEACLNNAGMVPKINPIKTKLEYAWYLKKKIFYYISKQYNSYKRHQRLLKINIKSFCLKFLKKLDTQ